MRIFRVEFKVLLLPFKAIRCLSPPYLSDRLHLAIPSHTLRSSTLHMAVPFAHPSTVGNRAFGHSAPKFWKSWIGNSTSLSLFQSKPSNPSNCFYPTLIVAYFYLFLFIFQCSYHVARFLLIQVVLK